MTLADVLNMSEAAVADLVAQLDDEQGAFLTIIRGATHGADEARRHHKGGTPALVAWLKETEDWLGELDWLVGKQAPAEAVDVLRRAGWSLAQGAAVKRDDRRTIARIAAIAYEEQAQRIIPPVHRDLAAAANVLLETLDGTVRIMRCPVPRDGHPCGRYFIQDPRAGIPREYCSDACRVRQHRASRVTAERS